MEHLSDAELIRNIQEKNCSDSLEVLTKRHAGIFYSMAKRYANLSNNLSGVSMRDFEENRHYIVYNAVKKFRFDKNVKFVTWLGNQVRYYCLNTLKSESKYYSTEPKISNFLINAGATDQPDQEKFKQEAEYIFDILEQLKDKRIKKIFKMRYFSEIKKHRSFSYIAQKLGMSTQGVIDIHNNFIEFIRNKSKSTNNMDKI